MPKNTADDRGFDSAAAPSSRRRRGAKARALSVPGSAPYWRRRYWSRRITGKGAYNWRSAVRSAWNRARPLVRAAIRPALTTGGNIIGTALGGVPGGSLGSAIGGALSTVVGAGAYSVSRNSLATDASQIPVMHSSNETIRITHREFLGPIITSSTAGDYSSRTFYVNPGLRGTFPWLSQVATCFQEYEIAGLIFMFKSNSADSLNSTNTALGSVLMGAQYNVNQPDYDSKADILNSMWGVEGRPSNDLILPIECDPEQNPFKIHYVRSGDLAATSNLQNYDLCKVIVATEGHQGTAVNIGDLWLSYDIIFRKPSIQIPSEGDDNAATLWQSPSTNALDTNTDPWLGATLIGDDLGLTLGGHSITFPPNSDGTYCILFNGVGTAGPKNTYIITLSNCTFDTKFLDGSGYRPLNTPTVSDLSYGFIAYIKATDVSDTFTLSISGGQIPTSSSFDLHVFQANRHNPL